MLSEGKKCFLPSLQSNEMQDKVQCIQVLATLAPSLDFPCRSYSLDELRIPAHDLKILERMALRVQEEKEREKKAEQKHKEWLEEERELRIVC